MAEHKPRKLECMAMRPGISLYLGGSSYTDTLHVRRHPKLRMYDVGPHALVQAVDESGKPVEEAEVLWHSVWWRKVAP